MGSLVAKLPLSTGMLVRHPAHLEAVSHKDRLKPSLQGGALSLHAFPVHGASLTFEGAASTAAANTITSFTWNFGDGTTVPVTPVSSGGLAHDLRTHAFAAAGTYTVTFTALDSTGGTNNLTRIVTVN